MLIALLTNDYAPLRTSAAVQMRDLAHELRRQGHDPTIVVPDERLQQQWQIEQSDGVRVFRVAGPNLRSGGNARRALVELGLPFRLFRALRASPLRDEAWDAVVWYSPTIFFGPLVWLMRRRSPRVATYLILRDIFPEWAVDLRVMRKGLVYWFFKLIAQLQYAMADTIGIQSPSNRKYLEYWSERRRIDVLNNWLERMPNVGCSLDLSATPLRGRTVFVYLGNVGIAQSLDIIIELATNLRDRDDIGFLFVGRGTEFARLSEMARSRALPNVLFHGEIEPWEVPGLLEQCHVGLLSLDPRHKTHNVPGKFLSYLHAGLPVIARVNPGIDLAGLIEKERIGVAYVGDSVAELQRIVLQFADDGSLREEAASRCKEIGSRLFLPEAAARQIVASVSRSSSSTLVQPTRGDGGREGVP